MIVTKRTTADLLDLIQRAASEMEGIYGPEDGLASELRDMHRRLLGVAVPNNPRRKTQDQVMDGRDKREKLRDIATKRVKMQTREKGRFIKMP